MGTEHRGLVDDRFEHDACGIGAVVSLDGAKSWRTVDDALKIVEKLEHRAGRDAAGDTGDGAGILLQTPHPLFRRWAERGGFDLGAERDYGVGMLFFSGNEEEERRDREALEREAAAGGAALLGWREVPVCPGGLGEGALSRRPRIRQCFLKRPQDAARGLGFDRRLYLIRRKFEKAARSCYVCSLSSRTVVYKGMLLAGQLRDFYPDLRDEAGCLSAIALVHSRFSTNTDPSWQKAHPHRLLLHNGEINTIRANAARMRAREAVMDSPFLRAAAGAAFPVLDAGGSDSAMLDNALEFLMMNGMELPAAVMAAIPEAWQGNAELPEAVRDLYRYWSTMMEPWDGPAALLFSDGDVVGATLDRNGLRPARFCQTRDGRLIIASEVGALDLPPEGILRKGRLRPGELLLADTVGGRAVENAEYKRDCAARHPFGLWLSRRMLRLDRLPDPGPVPAPIRGEELNRLCRAFGYTQEDLSCVILPMAETGTEAISSMGADVPLAVLAGTHRPLFDYFQQMFAQVTNPPIDAIREEIVTDASVYIGPEGNLLRPGEENCAVLRAEGPVLTGTELAKVLALREGPVRAQRVSTLFGKDATLASALEGLLARCDEACARGANALVLSDRGLDARHMAIPSLLAAAALGRRLSISGRRAAVTVIVESGEPRDGHHVALLLGYGARAVQAYLAEDCVRDLCGRGRVTKGEAEALDAWRDGILHSVKKIASKMGISTVQAYQDAQLFEAVGIGGELLDSCFPGTPSRVGGIGLEELEEDLRFHHAAAFGAADGGGRALRNPGRYRLRSGEGCEDHLYSPRAIVALQEAVRGGSRDSYAEYAALIGAGPPHALRDLLEFRFGDRAPVPLEEVEPADAIVRRFRTGAMSYGSLSEEAHKCLAEAMNRLGGRSNSGEGGEAPERLNGPFRSRVKQVASGRFGVTMEYLLSADEIQIKMAQGAKPGEGGHLPGRKVYPWIARTRHSIPGVQLISPPPHHDIYSIEDLAQLIYDLKNANRGARITVKLVAEAGVGTVASGVAKAGAQGILISGHDGGTGAAPLSSIHHAGLPWELGLAETQQTLLKNGLRARVRLETDGKLMTGRDVAVAALLGAEEFGFATAPLVAMGCMMMRVCDRDSCPTGIATQNPKLRARFRGEPEQVIRFMRFVAEELRGIMARLGLRTVDEMVGRSGLLRARGWEPGCGRPKLDLDRLLDEAAPTGRACSDPGKAFDFRLGRTLDERVLLRDLGEALKSGEKASCSLDVSSTDRTLGTILGSEVARLHGNALAEDTLTVSCRGGAGQSFGAFIPSGLTLRLAGDANDSLGKGLSGGKITLRPPAESPFEPGENVIAGNAALYGATAGKAFLSGIAGERFCVRNSGALAVVEGLGDHGCEYMTGGVAVVLGRTGRNFAAGMSGGIAYVLDEEGDFLSRLNRGMVRAQRLSAREDIGELRGLLEAHRRETGSKKAGRILDGFDAWLPLFWKVVPADYGGMLRAIAACEAQGLSEEQAWDRAFSSLAGG